MFLNPDTAPSVIAGANGEYAGANSTTQAFNFDLMDAFGHVLPFGSYPTFNSTSSISSGAGGSITAGGANIRAFTLTFGPGDGTMDITVSTTYIGVNNSQNIAIPGLVRTAGVNGS